MSTPSETTMQRLTLTLCRAAETRPDLIDTLGAALDHLEWLTLHGFATDATWRDLTACIAAASLTKPALRTYPHPRPPAGDPGATQRPLRLIHGTTPPLP